jgi:DNA-binding NarL/FixJ family response regulator
MNQWLVLAGLVIAVALCALLVAFYAYLYACRVASASEKALRAARECAAALEILQGRLAALAAEISQLPREAPAEPPPGMPRSGLNLTKRSQALRLRRKGVSPQQIAESLEIPRQEVDLLFKVHEIVLNKA